MNEKFSTVEEIITAYKANKVSRHDVVQWLERRKEAAQPAPKDKAQVKSPGISLRDPASGAFRAQGEAAAQVRRSVSLAPLPLSGPVHDAHAAAAPATGVSSPCEIDLVDHGDGIFALDVRFETFDGSAGNPAWTRELAAGLAQGFASVADRQDAKVLLLRGSDRLFLPAGDAPAEMDAFFGGRTVLLPLTCPVPVIAVMKGNAEGLGWLFGALCDFMICSEEGAYRYAERGTDEERQLLDTRFPHNDMHTLLMTETARSGRELRDGGLGVPVYPSSEVDAAAAALARQLGAAPRQSLTLLKQHLAQDFLEHAERLAGARRFGTARRDGVPFIHHRKPEQAWNTYVRLARDARDTNPDLGAARMVAIGSDVVTVQEHANGAVVVTLCDKRGRNTFTEDLIDGVTKAFAAIKNLPGCKAVVLTGYDNYFSCGGTKESLLAIQSGKSKFTDIAIYGLAAEMPVPVIAAMQGHGVGAGWALGMFCDIAIFSEKHTYVSPYMRYGFTPGAGSTLVFLEKFGADLGREILFSAHEYTGSELKRRGMPFPVVPAAEVTTLALALANRLAGLDRESLEAMKRDSGARIRQRLQRTFMQEQAMHQVCFVGNDDVLARIQAHFNDGLTDEHEQSPPVGQAEPQQDEATPGEVVEELRRMLAEELFMDACEIDNDQKFVDIGLDSITGVNWVRKINARFGMSINATKVYGHPTLREFANYVAIEGKRAGVFGTQKRVEERRDTPAADAPQPSQQSLSHAMKIMTIRPSAGAAEPPMVVDTKPSQPAPAPATTQTTMPATAPASASTADAAPRRFPSRIAVIGMAGQFPKARNLSEYWRNLVEGHDCITEIPADRWDVRDYYDPDRDTPGKTYSKWMGVLDDAALFDPLFFNISPREAEWMDPQQRVFLQNAWHCVEDAGYNSSALAGSKCGVFVGCASGDYSEAIRREDLNAQNFMGKAISILAAKISYTLDLQGPCVSIDTACSSSLVALAAACDSLVLGSSDLAIAGGVCVMAGPDMHIMTSKAGMLSADGRCFTFDQRANGFVPGEGVGAVLLKRLEDAERDGDHIYGVIGGWGINQDGKTNGITAPNPQSQARLEQDIYRKFGIDPTDIQLVETHGTGTKLGDPIEVEGLKDAFRSFTDKTGYCALGSVKSNIGHALAAAGIAGTIKLLLCLKHAKMPPTIHFEQLNEHIELQGSPFYVNDTCKDWLPQPGKTRRAAISSFGFSGTNAHVVIEEYMPAMRAPSPAEPLPQPAAVVLSAKSAQRLTAYAQQLLDFLSGPEGADVSLADLAYTLQVGREPMEFRLAIEARTMKQLRERLAAVVSGDEAEGVVRGQVQRSDETVAMFGGSEELQEAMRKWAASNQLGKLLAMWVKGVAFDWSRLHADADPKPHRISLPGYPFDLKRYWLPTPAGTHASRPLPGFVPGERLPQMLHPLLHRNTSTLFSEHRYSSRFTGKEFFFAQHVIKGRKVLPGVGHLEMVRAAVKEACGIHADTRFLQIKNVVWMRPIACHDGDNPDERTVIHISLAIEENEEIAFRIYSGGEHGDQDIVIHSQGVAVLHAADVIPAVDLEALRSQCSDAVVDASHHFDAMVERGADLGRGFRGIGNYYLGANPDGVPQVLAHITIPDGLSEAADRFVLHPTAMDAAVHTAPPLMEGWEDAGRSPLALPFALEELEVLGSCQEEMWALARPAAGAASGSLKYDIDLCDDAGMVCVRFKGFSFRVFDKEGPGGGKPRASVSQQGVKVPDTLMLRPEWHDQRPIGATQASDRRLVVLCGLGPRNAFESRFGAAELVCLSAATRGADSRAYDATFADYAREAFAIVQNLLKQRVAGRATDGRVLIQFVGSDDMLSALAGLMKTLRRENPKVDGQIILVDSSNDVERIAQQVEENVHAPHDTLVRYRDGRRQIQRWTEIAVADKPVPMPWKEGGVYLITGGAGALGSIFVQEALRQLDNVTLVLTGRSALDEQLEGRLAELKKSARRPATAAIVYRQADVSNAKEVEALVRSVTERHGRLNGVLHSAGVIRDNFIMTKSQAEMTQVLAPKVAGTINLDRATESLNLDFFVLFSSIASGIGNAGQADYAMANAFMDAFAGQRRRDRRGSIVSINWPLWKEGGMAIDAQTEQWMQENTGMQQMRTSTGIDAFYRALASDLTQLMVLEGDGGKMRQSILDVRTTETESASDLEFAMTSDAEIAAEADSRHQPMTASSSIGQHQIVEQSNMLQEQAGKADPSLRFDDVLARIKPVVASILKIEQNELDIDKELINYGFDSITLTEFTNNLNKQYRIPSSRALNPTVFFEHPTMRSFVKHLAQEYREIGATVADTRAVAAASVQASGTPAPARAAAAMPRRAAKAVAAPAPQQLPSGTERRTRSPIAVVGMSGRFPMARNIREYWRNLAEGRDCISEVPADRWNWREIYGDPSKEGNKTDVKWGGFMEGVAEFDSLFFGISPREALYMDPMQRLLMEHMWHAVEDAGYSARALSGTKTGIFVGTSVSEYGMLLQQSDVPCDAFLPTGRSPSLGANRMSYLLNLTGPSETVDTACSSSLVAIHRAVMAMESGHCDMALVGGVNVLIAPDGHISFRKAGMLSEDGRCKTFSSRANGYARGEGVGILFLKRLDDAERDGDYIYGLVRGSGENHGGRASSLTAPNPKAQADLIKTVYRESGIDPRTVGFVEAHGTGTELGDPVEVNGLKMAFRDLYQATGDTAVTTAHCGLGSAKSNIGHLELAAGVAGAIKVLLQLKNKALVKSLHSEEINPYIQLQNTPFYVVRDTIAWPAIRDGNGNELPRRAGVSSFGFGGANAHILFEEYRGPADGETSMGAEQDVNREHLIVLSAKNEERLKDAAQQLLNAVATGAMQDKDLERIAYTLQVGREAFEERLGLKASSLQDLRDKLEAFVAGNQSGDLYRGRAARNDQTLTLFDAEELKETVAKWVSRRQYSKLLTLWTKGYDVDWQMLYADRAAPPRRVSLPGYPFARERIWPEGPRTIAVSSQPAAAPADMPARVVKCLKKDWEPSAVAVHEAAARAIEGTVLILATDETMPLARRVAAQAADGRIVNLSDPRKTDAQWNELDNDEACYAGCIDLVGCGTQAPASMDSIVLLQKLIGKKTGSERPMMLLGVSKGLEAFGGNATNLAGASRAGLYRMLQSEYAKLRSRHLDADASDDDAALERWVVAEWLADSDESEVCYRQGCRHTAILREMTLPQSVPARSFSPDQVLWITGGTRGIGLLCAEHFVKHYGVKKLMLTGREAIPPRSEWNRLAADAKPENAQLARKIEALLKLERQGVQVETLAVALDDSAAVRDAVRHVTAGMGRVGGVLHCAGLNDRENPAFVRKSVAQFEKVLAPKVTGLDVLLAALRQEPLQFFALFSSVSSVVPALGAGQSDYVAANVYMDYVAQAHAGTCPIISIQWPSWKETGMGEATTKAYRQSGFLSHSNAEGLDLLDRVLAHKPGAVILPAVVDESAWQPRQLMLRSLAVRTDRPAEPKRDTAAAPVTATAVGVPADLSVSVLSWLAMQFSKELRVPLEKLDKATPFQDYGVDSIMLTQILRRVEEAFSAHGKTEPMDPSVFYEYPTLGSFAQWLIQTYPGPLAGVLGISATAPAPVSAPVEAAAQSTERTPEAPLPPQTPVTANETPMEAAPRSQAATGDIAVVGVSCRFPGADDLDGFWKLLSEGRSAIRTVPPERWGRATAYKAGMLSDVIRFDPSFFLIPDNDARAMDAQALLLLEETLGVLHHAGYGAKELKGSATGVFIGARSGHRPDAGLLSEARNPIVAVGQNYLAANISQFFDLQGPSVVIDTACSSALVAMNIAVQSLQTGEIDAALVGGISLLQSEEAHQLFERRNLLSRSGEFHVFDRRAGGVVLGEGVGMVMLKTLERALEDGDQIHAVLKGLAINNDGRTAGPASPNLQAQKAVMQQALRKSGKRAEDISYIHVNGSGSEVTDLLELKALEAVYRPSDTAAAGQCELGSMEPNIGHPLCAKGIAGFIQVVLMLSRQKRVPFLSGREPMTHYDIGTSPFCFGRELSDWTSAKPVAAVNCFADGGTNAHAILEAWRETSARTIRRRPLAMPNLNRRAIRAEAAQAAPLPDVWCREGQADSVCLRLGVDHPILRNHVAYGQQLLPGLAYIDILYQHFERQGIPHRELELRNLSIYQPLIVGEDFDVLLDVRCTPHADGHWQIQLEGRERRGSELSENKRYAVAEMRRVAPVAFDETLRLEDVARSAKQTLDLADLYAQCARQGLNHTGMIKAQGRVHETDAATYIEIGVGPEAMVDAHGYRFHPTLIDGSSVGAQRLFAAFFEGEDRLILPLFYESFRACAPLQTHCMTRIAASSLRRKNELLYMNLEFFDTEGRKVAELSNYACKLVRDEGAINPERRQASKKEGDGGKQKTQAAAMPVASARIEVPAAAGGDGSVAARVERFLVELMAARVKLPADQIDTQLGYYELGLDSARLLDLVGELEKKIGASLAPTLLFEYTNIAELAVYLAEKYPSAWGENQSSAASGPAVAASTPADIADIAAGMPERGVMPAAAQEEDIAIIGMAGRYPGANTLEEFWNNLKAGKDCVTEVPASRWERARLQGVKSPSGKEMSRWGGFIDNPECFDAQFFRVSPWEAKLLDPQQRHFLEVCWEAIEDAGYTPKTLVAPRGRHQRRDVGVYVGVMHNDYAILTADAVARGEMMPVSLNYAQIANRVSYFCNFHGPSMAIDTVCSSSLIAVHMAVESLRRGECEAALAGGVNLSVHPIKYLTYGLMDMHASDGRCRTFGKDGDGYVSGEGIGAVLLKPLSKAVRDNDHIYAVIKGSTTNHVGAVSGLTVPSPVAQADMIEECLERTGIHPRTISYVEAHGTGTSLGDPIELQGLVKAFGRYTSDRQFCSIGSVKSNIGHAESAAGISGLTKLALQLHHRTLVPSLHSAELNPYLDFANSPFYVQHAVQEWEQPVLREGGREVRIPRRAAISSFGASGSNAHIILEEYVAPQAAHPQVSQRRAVVVPLSAKKSDRLHAYAERLLEHVRRHAATLNLADLAYTLQAGREAMDERLAFVASDITELIAQLQAFISGSAVGGREAQAAFRGTVQKGKKPSLAMEDDPQQMLARWIASGNMHKLAQSWVQGAAVDWKEAHRLTFPDTQAHRISLPTYPFARDRHWLDAPKGDLSVAAPAAALVAAPVSAPAAMSAAAGNDILYFVPRWQAQPLTASSTNAGSRMKTTVFVVAGDAGRTAETMRQWTLADRVIELPTTDDIAAELKNHVLQLLQYCKDSDRIRRSEPELLLLVAPHRGTDHPYRSLMGALRTISLELPFIKTRLVLDSALVSGELDRLQANLRAEIAGGDGFTEIAYPTGQQRQVLTQQVLETAPLAGDAPLTGVIRQRGVYLITGGLGGLGMMFAEHIGKGTGARIVLTGRSLLNTKRKASLAALADKGVNVEYLPCDTARLEDVRRLVDHVVGEYGTIHGVIHSAGIVSDNFIPKKTESEVAEVMAAKVPSIVNLDVATSGLALDFFVSFSSSAALGNAGQLDYATANAFLDAFAGYRAALAARGERKGRSLSVNWPLWRSGGMSVQPAYEKFMFEKFGIVPLEEEPGVRALATALASSEHQFGVFQGDRAKIGSLLARSAQSAQTPMPQNAQASSPAKGRIRADQRDNIESVVRQAVAQALGMEAETVDLQVEFADYGMDSIGATKIANFLNTRLGLEYTGAVFLELNSAEKLIQHLRDNEVERIEQASASAVEPDEAPAFAPVAMPVSGTASEPDHPPVSMPVPAAPAPAAGQFGKIAIVGYDARLPGADDVETYWQNVLQKSISIREVPTGEWKQRGVAFDGRGYGDYPSMQHAGLLDRIDGFDADFWGLTEDQARDMDPQERLLLQSIWRCVERSGRSMKELTRGKVGLFLALDSTDYQTVRGRKEGTEKRAAMSVGMITNQISYLCNFTGPSEAVDVACASTYVSLKRAAQALAWGECDTAIVGGAKILLDPAGFIGRDEGEILSRSGLMYPFDAQADGYVRGEGIGCVLLKRLDRALEDGDTIHAVIAGVGVTHNGKAALSQVAPSVDGQYRAIREAYRTAGIAPETIAYIEAHGTSNSFSDASELAAFKQYFKEAMDPESYQKHRCAVSTVKANIGHLEGASGVASLIKVICAIRDRKIAPIATWTKLHPSILLSKSPFYIPTEVTLWERPVDVDVNGNPVPLRVGLHSIGIGGVNAHVILEEHLASAHAADDAARAVPEPGAGELVVLSAKSKEALEAYCKKWHAYLSSKPMDGRAARILLSDIASSSQQARDAMPFRAAFVVSDLQALSTALALGPERIEQQPIDAGGAFASANTTGAVRKDKEASNDHAASSPADLKAIAKHWLAGGTVDWSRTNGGRRRYVDIPGYPFQDRKLWFSEPSDPFEALFHETFMASKAGEPELAGSN